MGTEEQQVEVPDMRDEDASLFCFLDDSRSCNGTCMAYTSFPRTSKDSELSEQQAHCSLLMSMERIGRGTIISASMLSKQAARRASELADQQRTGQFTRDATHSPFGGKKEGG